MLLNGLVGCPTIILRREALSLSLGQERCPFSLYQVTVKVNGMFCWCYSVLVIALVCLNKIINGVVGSHCKVLSQGQFKRLKSGYCFNFLWDEVEQLCSHIFKVRLKSLCCWRLKLPLPLVLLSWTLGCLDVASHEYVRIKTILAEVDIRVPYENRSQDLFGRRPYSRSFYNLQGYCRSGTASAPTSTSSATRQDAFNPRASAGD